MKWGAQSLNITHLIFLWHFFSTDRKRVIENSKTRFQIFEISKSFFECVGNFSNPHEISATSWFSTEEVATIGIAYLLSRNVVL